MINYKIRLAEIEDEEGIVRCIDAAYEKYIPIFGGKPSAMTSDYKTKIKNKQMHVLEINKTVVGTVLLVTNGDCLHLSTVTVHPDMQGRGMGRELVLYSEDHARTLNLKEIQLYTNEILPDLVHFYKKLGYQKIKKEKEDGFSRIFFKRKVSE